MDDTSSLKKSSFRNGSRRIEDCCWPFFAHRINTLDVRQVQQAALEIETSCYVIVPVFAPSFSPVSK